MGASEEEEVAAGSPAWMATFADLMSLLMCFFVLLLSFSEMDAQKYKLVAGSMKNAFGVQQEVFADESPSGEAALIEDALLQDSGLDAEDIERLAMLIKLEELLEETAEDVKKLEESMVDEIQGGFIELESGFRSITIRIKEKGSFDSGSASLQEEFVGVMAKLQANFIDIEGKISVEGHTDNIDISTALFSSNWALSSARALSVGHELLKGDLLRKDRFIISGYSDTVPVVDNITAEGRAINRRVEIVIRQPVSREVNAGIMALDEDDPQVLELLDGQSIENLDQ